jgi:hypothetical protein
VCGSDVGEGEKESCTRACDALALGCAAHSSVNTEQLELSCSFVNEQAHHKLSRVLHAVLPSCPCPTGCTTAITRS